MKKNGKNYGDGLLKLQRYDLENLMFPDLSVFTNEDILQLKAYAQNLISSNNVAFISKITKIISRYTSISYDTLLSEYNSVKALRLGN